MVSDNKFHIQQEAKLALG